MEERHTQPNTILQKVRLHLTRRRLIVSIVVLIVLAVILSFTVKQQQRPNLNNIDVVLADVGRHYLLPTTEKPALATITDKSKLTSALFARAQNGDKVLIYQTNKIAIIYRPSIDRIIAVGPVSIDTPPGAPSTSTNSK